MAGIDDYLQEALQGYKPTNLKKEEAIADTSDRKKQGTLDSLRSFNGLDFATNARTGRGSATQSRLDNDLKYMPEYDLKQEYGPEVTEALLSSRDTGTRMFDDLQRTDRDMLQGAGDTAIGLGLGASNSVGGLLSAIVGLADRDAGIGTANIVQSINDFGSSYQSDALKDRKTLYESKSNLAGRDNKYLAESGMFGDTYFMESADRILRDASTSIAESVKDPMLLGNLTSEGIGSLAGGSVVGKAVSSGIKGAVGITAAKTAAAQSGKIEDILAVAGRARKTEIATMTGVISGMEAGGAYNDTVGRIMQMKHDQLMETSPYYKKQMEMHGDKDKAKRETAHAAGQKALLVVAPLAAVAGRAVAKFEMNPLSGGLARSYKGTAANIGTQTLEEGFQGVLSSKASNVAIKDYANQYADTDVGVGRALGEGALAGTAMAASISAPGLAAKTTVDTVKAITKRLGRVGEANKKASPLSRETLNTASSEINTNSEDIASTFEAAVQAAPEAQREEASQYVQSLLDLGNHVEGSYGKDSLNAITMDSASKYEAIEKLAQVAGDPNANPQTRLDAGLALMEIEQQTIRTAEQNPEAFAELADDSPAAMLANGILGVLESTFKNPEITKVTQAIQELMSQEGVLPKVDETSHTTPEGLAAIQTAVQVAQVAPNKGNLESNRAILAQNENGDISLTESQQAAVRVSIALLSAEKNRDRSSTILGEGALNTGKEITFEGGAKGLSITEHAMGILKALSNKDTERAKESLEDLGMFAQHMANKVMALNENIQNGGVGNQKYQSWNQKVRKWFESDEGLFLNGKSKRSIELAQEISHEAGLAIESYNNLIDATKLDLPKIPMVQVNSNLVQQTLSATPETAFAESTPPVDAYEDGSIQFEDDGQIDSDLSDQQSYAEMESELSTEAQKAVTPSIPTMDIEAPAPTTINIVDTDTPAPKKKGVHEYTKEEEAARTEATEKKKAATAAKVEADRVAALPKNIVEFKGKKGNVSTYKVTDTNGVLTTSRVLKDGTEKPLVPTGAAHAKVVNQYLINTTGVGSPPKVKVKRKGPRKEPDANKDSLIDFIIRLGGISAANERLDITGDVKGNRQIVGVGYLFNSSDNSSADHVGEIQEAGFIPQDVIESGNQETWLSDTIREQYNGETPLYVAGSDAFNLQAEQELYARYESELEEATGEANPTLTESIEAEKTSLELLLEESRRQHASLAGVVRLEDQTAQTDQRTSAAEDAKKSQEAERAAREAEPRLGVTKIISGGQTGGDIGGVRAGKQLGVETGGTLPNGWKTQDGSKPEYATEFGMTQDSSSSYVPRTMKNVDNADATIAVVWGKSVGTDKTIGYAQTGKWGYGVRETKIEGGHRPVLVITTKDVKEAAKQIREFVLDTGAKTLNIAGHREGSQPGIEAFTTKMLVDALDVNVEAKPEQAVTTEQEATPAVEEAKPVVTEAETAPLSGLASIFPNLLFAADVAKNVFLRTFKFGTEQRTNMVGEEAPLDKLRDLLGSQSALAKVAGDKWRSKLDETTQDAWAEYMEMGQELIYSLDDAVIEFLHGKRGKDKTKESRMEYMERTGKSIHETDSGLLLNIMEEVTRTDKNGKEYASYALNKELTENGTAAAMHWLLNDAQNVTNYDSERIASTLGISQTEVTPEIAEYFNNGNIMSIAIADMGAKIQQYWGMGVNSDSYIGDQQGIVESLARELINGMIKNGLVTSVKGSDYSTIVYTDATNKNVDKKNSIFMPDKVVFNKAINSRSEEKKAALQKTSTALEEIYIKEPDLTRYIGSDAIPKMSTHQLRNPLAAITRQQKKALAQIQKTEYFIDPTMVGLYGMLGSKGLVNLFSTDSMIDENFNVNHQKSVTGQNKGISGAFEDFAIHLEELQDIAEFENKPLHEVATRYKYEYSSVNRMQMQGKFTPQSSKYIREVMLPTWSTLDLSDPSSQASQNFDRAVAQALGIKIHKKDPSMWKPELDKNLAKLAPAIEMVESLLRNVKDDNLLDQIPMEDGDVAKLKETMKQAGVDITPLTLHAIADLAKLSITADKSKFRTSLYLEADGMTNGPANAMMMLSGGMVNPQWVTNMERGGFYINQNSMNAGLKNGKGKLPDMYEEAARILKNTLMSKSDKLTKNPNFILYNMFTSDITFGADNDLNIGRNLVKNPLTVMIYGSGLGGVADKMSTTLIDSIYERMSAAQEAMSKDPSLSIELALFPDVAGESIGAKNYNAKREYGSFLYAFGALIDQDLKGTVINPRTFTIGTASKNKITKSISKQIAEPLQEAIQEVVGEEVFHNAERIRKAGGIMSAYAAAIQRKMMAKQFETNKKRNPGYRKRQLITQQQRREFEKEALRVAAVFGSKTQNFFINGESDYDSGINTSLGLDEKQGITGHIAGFGNAGVKAIAYMNISIDGQMMQNGLSTDSEIGNRQLPTFDGMQSPIDGIQEVGQQMNQAVWDSWNDNSTLAIGERLAEFSEILDLSIIDEQGKLELSKVFSDDPKSVVIPFSDEVIQDYIGFTKERLLESGREHKALMTVLSNMNTTTDQMAGTDNPLVRANDKNAFKSTDPEEIAQYVREEVQKILGKKTNQSDVGTILSDRIARDVAKGKKPEGVYVITKQELGNLLGSSEITADQKSIIKEALDNDVLNDWRILVGNPKDIKNFVKDKAVGIEAFNTAMNQNYEGFTDPANKLIVLLNGTGETLAHELTHAGTYQKMDNFFRDPNSVTKEEAEAIQRTEALANQFLSFDARTVDHLPGLQATITKVQNVVSTEMIRGNKAAALNEFMAWTLSNRELADQAKKTKATKLGQLIKDAWEAIKAIFGSKYLPKVGKDVYSNLRFNSTVLSANQDSVADFVNSSPILAQNNNAGSGNVDLDRLNAVFSKVIVDVVDSRVEKTGKKRDVIDLAEEMTYAIDVTTGMQAAFFDMTPEESMTFGKIVAAMATEAPLNSIALSEANKLYTTTIENLTLEMFMKDATNDQERYVANAKYNAIVGKSVNKEDTFGRSSILPAFLAMALVNKDFRDVLSKIEAPKARKSEEGGLNGAIENLGYKLINDLGERLVGTNKAENVQASIDILGEVIAREAFKEETYLELGLAKTGGFIDSTNDYMVKAMGVLSDRAMPNRTPEERAAQNKGEKLLDGVRMVVAGLTSEKNAEIFSKGISDTMDKSQLSEWFRNLMSDMTGRTEGNKDVWDMVKQFRSKIQVVRQGYRDDLPDVIRSEFTRELTKEEDSSVYRSLGKTEIASLMVSGMTVDAAVGLVTNKTARKAKQNQLVDSIGTSDVSRRLPEIVAKAKQLATFMNTGKEGNDLARNARAIVLTNANHVKLAQLEKQLGNFEEAYQQLYGKTESQVDQLVSLYAVDGLSSEDINTFTDLAKNEKKGLEFTLSYLKSQIIEERNTDSLVAKINSYKGYMPFESKGDVSLKVADDLEYVSLIEQGYVKLGAFTGSNIMPQRGKSYYFMPKSAKAAFKQGIVQNIRQTKGGVDPVSGYTAGTIVQRYTNRSDIAAIQKRMSRQNTDTPLLPVFDQNGVVVAYEQGISQEKKSMVADEQNLFGAIGKWRGRQIEEYLAELSNKEMVGKLKDTYEKDIGQSMENAKKYVDLFKSEDPVIIDAVGLIPFETRKAIMAAFDGRFMVQRGMVKEVVGYRNASVGDFWTGNSRHSIQTQKTVKRVLVGMLGNDAYVKLAGKEEFIENVVNTAKDLIATKSVIVPAINIISNVLHAIARGTPIMDIIRGYAKYTKEINTYMASRQDYIVAEAKLRAATNANEIAKLEAIMRTIDDSHRRMDIWPLIEAGEFTAVSSADNRYADVKLASGKIGEYLDDAAKKLPDGLNTAGKYLIVAKETSLYNALQKSVEYGDFVAKAVYYEDMVKRQGLDKATALGRVSEEYISYDHLPGRARGKLENLGLLWFYNFKLRSTKIALSTIRNNPLHTMLALGVPAPTVFGTTGIPVQDNVITKILEGSIGYSIGPGQGINSVGLNPWYNLFN